MEQDWTTIVFKKRPTSSPSDPRAVRVAQRNGDAVDTLRKVSGEAREYSSRARKLEADLNVSPTEAPPPQVALPRLDAEMRKVMIQARVAKKLTQAQLANAANTQPKTINDIEAGGIITDRNIVVKINRVLGTKLRLT